MEASYTELDSFPQELEIDENVESIVENIVKILETSEIDISDDDCMEILEKCIG